MFAFTTDIQFVTVRKTREKRLFGGFVLTVSKPLDKYLWEALCRSLKPSVTTNIYNMVEKSGGILILGEGDKQLEDSIFCSYS